MTPPNPTSDAATAAELCRLHAVAAGDRHAFEALYRHHHSGLTRFLRRFTARADLIEDVVNDTMWIVWRQAAEFRGASKVSTWIIGIAYRSMLKALRGTAPPQEWGEVMLSAQDLEQASAAVAPADEGEQRELSDWVRQGLRSLPHDQRVTLELAYFMGLSCEEIAEVMGCAVGTIKARMFHARVRLRSVMPALAGQARSEQG